MPQNNEAQGNGLACLTLGPGLMHIIEIDFRKRLGLSLADDSYLYLVELYWAN